MEKCNDEPDIEEQPDSSNETGDSNMSCNNGEYLFTSGPEGSRTLKNLMENDLHPEDSVTLLRGENTFNSVAKI